ncbi:hypothetical protein AA12717_1869 [Gluconacetobacter sacchari DSM 12717]|uniref:Transposase n=1 Tax=Gluconacetobacter sacchari DSM 12717 TaxID=1307940 RepID=A0ABQ0P6V7_9PROT|nr:hypothetical protein AA12717_1869 [Gluconacetobacter sacchari DSM 12717]
MRERARARERRLFSLVVIQEAGLDGFWIDRALKREDWIESYVVDAASIVVSRKHRRAKTDRFDFEMLVRTLLAFKRGAARVCSIVRPPSREEEDRRHHGRERKVLVGERTRHINRVKGLSFGQGIRGVTSRHDGTGVRASTSCERASSLAGQRDH